MAKEIKCTVIYPNEEGMKKLRNDLAMTMIDIAVRRIGIENMNLVIEEMKRRRDERGWIALNQLT